MKILLVSNGIPPEKKGGTEIYTYTLAKHLAGRNLEVGIIAFSEKVKDKSIEFKREDNISIYTIGNKASRLNPIKRFKSTYFNKKLDTVILKVINEFKPDLLHIQHLIKLSSGFLEKINIPYIVTLNDFWFICPLIQMLKPSGILCDNSNPGNCMECIRQKYHLALTANLLIPFGVKLVRERNKYLVNILNNANAVISPSFFLMDVHKKNGINNKNFKVLRYGLDIRRFILPDIKKNTDKFKIIYIGSILPHKGLDILVKVFQKLKIKRNPELHIYGYNGGDDKYFNTWARTIPEENIFFHGAIDNTDVPKILKQMNLLVVPSKWYENSPIIIYESYLSELPFLVSDLGGMKELVEVTGAGAVFQVGDSSNLAENIKSIIIQTEAFDFKPEFKNEININNHVIRLEELYNELF
ncbi:glycosyltransferase [Candidatus Dependentiae bacterium]|nr:glycosyltransferase [Candidatus Dependentiae bacterium]